MGWLYMSLGGMGGFRTPKTYLDDQLTYAPDPEKGRTRGSRVLKSVWQGRVYYAAVEPYGQDGAEPALAIICLVHWKPKSQSGEHFGYKDLTETMGPYDQTCPASVLDLLGTPRNDHAEAWRKACRARLALLARPKPKAGDRLILPEPQRFTDDYEARAFTIVTYRGKVMLRGDNGGLYRLSKLMERPWSLVPAAKPLAKSP
ncbi:DUF6927 domain-containing protein [Novosphingobium terrae]|uniref:DUF6927 domain-containing protein n=1 Tax=Novosphingobium terrae TaxID=2726189 RepID=UPI00197E0200|nr:hypothetical protein [Novosphingobium terrae]